MKFILVSERVYQQFIATVVVRSAATGPDICASTMKYHAVDKYDTPPSHFQLTMDQPALF